MICLDAASGHQLWRTPIGPTFDFEGNSWGAGPRATPSVADDLVYALGGHGNLICVDAASGTVRWSKHMMRDLDGEGNPSGGGPGSKPGEAKIGWGYSGLRWSTATNSSVFRAELAAAGRAGPPFRRGSLAECRPDRPGLYASPILADIESVRQYIVLHNGGLTGGCQRRFDAVAVG